MANSIHLAICTLLSIALSFKIINGHPLSPEDVEGLLPSTPKTKNETVAAIVEDTVVQEAIQSVVGDGTLSGLVVKKNTVILPADQPDVILSQNEQILEAPLTHLEDIRKNITETAAAISEKENSEVTGVEEISLAEVVPVNDKIVSDPADPAVPDIFVSEKTHENHPEILIADSLVLDKKESSTLPIAGNKLVVPGILQNEIKFPAGVFPDNISLPSVIDDQISQPVMAVLKQKNLTGYHGSVIALLSPISAESTSETKNFIENSDKEIAEYGTRIPVAVITSEELNHPGVKIEARNLPDKKTAKNVVAVFTVDEDDSQYYQTDDNDMVAAEDIIFRPLFRYRQQQNDRLRILDNRAYQKSNYNRYRQSSDNFGDYNSRMNSYKKPKRTRYYNDYY